jgi:hypothetical protein
MPRSHADLILAAGHLDYEFSEFVKDARRIHDDNAFLEAHLLHARTLIEFLIGRGRRHPNDITPEDFVTGWVVPDTDASRRLRGSLTDIDQHLSHLSWKRVEWMHEETDPKPWSYLEIVNDMIAVFGAFVTFAHSKNAAGSWILVKRLETVRVNRR